MTPYSSLAVINRSLTKFESLISALATHSYSETCVDLQKRLQGLYNAFLSRLYDGLTAEYRISNESGMWEEEFYLKEDCHGTPYLTLMFETGHSSLDITEAEDENVDGLIEPDRALEFVDGCFEHAQYAHVLFRNEIKQFIHGCMSSLSDTHTFDIEANEGVFCFQALPINGSGTIRMISRSNDAVIDNDIDNIAQLGLIDQGCILKEVRSH